VANTYLNRRNFVKMVGLGAASMLVPGCNITIPQPKKKPNFVFFLVDDLGWKDLVCYGSSFYETPNIDKLAKGSMRFTNAYDSLTHTPPVRSAHRHGQV